MGATCTRSTSLKLREKENARQLDSPMDLENAADLGSIRYPHQSDGCLLFVSAKLHS